MKRKKDVVMRDGKVGMKEGMALLAGVVVAFSALGGEVKCSDSSIVLPTYLAGALDKTPVFYTGRVYQGAQGRVYPYPMQDVLHDEKKDVTYRYLTLENDWLQLGVLPEYGGHLLNLTDKRTGFETFYRQHVIKPALIGMLGAWISGGVEWNFPHHHRATSVMPIDWCMTECETPNADGFGHPAGTKTLWLGEVELRRRLKWTIGLSLLPDRAVLEAQNIFINRGPYIESMLYWANVSASCGEDYQVIFPPSCHLGFDHHKRSWTSYPIGHRTTDPDDREPVDVSWWKNFTVDFRSIFAMDPDNAWLVGYDYGKNAGTAHVSNRHVTVGKKFFLWGNFPAAQMWDSKVLTDSDGPYLELMVGCWSDNQPDYSWIAPYETRRVKQFWYPVKGIGGVKNVTLDGAVNVERRSPTELLVGFHSTRALRDCMIRVSRSGDEIFAEKNVDIDPNTPWCRIVRIPAEVRDQELTASIADEHGVSFVSYTPVGPDPHDPLPPNVASPQSPSKYVSAELAYLTGLRLEQFHNGVLDPMPYYERALEIDSSHSQANLAIGIRLMKNGEFGKAEPFLRKAVDRVNQNYTRAKDVEPEYYLALCLEETGRLKEAEDLFWRATWRATHKKESFVGIVRIYCRQGRYREAHDVLEEELLPIASNESKVHVLHAYVHRRLHENANPGTELDERRDAQTSLKRAVSCDPLEYWGRCEAAFCDGGQGADALCLAERNRGLKTQQLLEAICDYSGLGAWHEVVVLCDAALSRAEGERPYNSEGAISVSDLVACCGSYRSPLFCYFKAYATERLGGDPCAIRASLELGEKMPTDYCFPSRTEELAVLRWASEKPSCGANTFYYLGEVLWHLDRKEEAVATWRQAVKINQNHSLALRCLGFALTHPGTYYDNTGTPAGVASVEGAECYRRAIVADPDNPRILLEAEVAVRRTGATAAERLALLNDHRATAEKYDPCVLRIVRLCLETGDYDEAVRILSTRHFHVWEGGSGLHDTFVDALVRRAERKMEEKDFKGARKDLVTALTYPENLEEARPNTHVGSEPRVYWTLAQCAKATGDVAAYESALDNVLKGKVASAEMHMYRARALKARGLTEDYERELSAVEAAIVELCRPLPRFVSAYEKFGGDESPDELLQERRMRADELRKWVYGEREVLWSTDWKKVTPQNGVWDVEFTNTEDSANCSFDFRVMRHADAIGVEAFVRDDKVVTDDSRLNCDSASTWWDDCLEVFFDGDNDRNPNTRGPDYRKNPTPCNAGGEYAIAANGSSQSMCASLQKCFGKMWGGIAEPWIENGFVKGTHYRLWFKYDCLGRKTPRPDEPVKFGFTICVHDDDDGGPNEYGLYWKGNPQIPFADESAFGAIELPAVGGR